MKKYILIALMILMTITGCAKYSEGELNLFHEGIIDACYTVIEYDKKDDRYNRIEVYLDKKIEEGEITKSESMIIKKCISRTQKSGRWSK